MIEFLKRHRVVRALVGGTAVVGAGAATGQAAIGNDSSTPPKNVRLGQPTKLDVEGTKVEVPPTTEVPAPAPMPLDTLDHPQANASAENTPATPNTTANTPHVNTTANTANVNTTANTANVNTTANTANVNTTANTANVNTTANTANTVSPEVEHRGPGRLGHEGGDHHGPARVGHEGGDHRGPGPAGHDGGDHGGPAPAGREGGDNGGHDGGGSGGSGSGSSGSGGGGGGRD